MGEGVFKGGVAVAFVGVSGVEGLFLCGESGGEAELIVVGGEPGVEDERGEEECGAGGGDFDFVAGGDHRVKACRGAGCMETGSWWSGSSLLAHASQEKRNDVVVRAEDLRSSRWFDFAGRRHRAVSVFGHGMPCPY